MTPEQLQKGNELSAIIHDSKHPFAALEKNIEHGAITFTHLDDSNNDIFFELKPDQIEMVKNVVAAMAKQNLLELETKFNEL